MRDKNQRNPTAEQELAAQIGRMDAGQQLLLQRTYVQQAATYAEQLLGDWPYPDERACLRAVAAWLEQPDAPTALHAVDEALDQESVLVMYDEEHALVSAAWDVARATRADALQAAQIARAIASQSGGWRAPSAFRVDPQRGPLVAARNARAAAGQWQLAAAAAMLRRAELPPLPELPEPPADPDAIVQAFRQAVDPDAARREGNFKHLLLLIAPKQLEHFAQLRLTQAIGCATLLLPPVDEDRGEQACLDVAQGQGNPAALEGLDQHSQFRQLAAAAGRPQLPGATGPLRAIFAALIEAQVAQHQFDLAQALAERHTIMPSVPWTELTTGRLAAYQQGRLGQLVKLLDSAQFLQFRQALVRQALWYATQVLPHIADNQRHEICLEAAERWANQPSAEHAAAAAQTIGPPLERAERSVSAAWNAARAVAEIVAAGDDQALLGAAHTAIVATIAATQDVSATSDEAQAALYLARDYQLATVWQLIKGHALAAWVGPEQRYCDDTFDAAIRRLNEAAQDLFRRTMLRELYGFLVHAVRAAPAAEPLLEAKLAFLYALLQWAELPDYATGETIRQARAALDTHQSTDNLFDSLRISHWLAVKQHHDHAQIWQTTRDVATYLTKAARFAAGHLIERWEVDAAYAILQGMEPPPLPATSLRPP